MKISNLVTQKIDINPNENQITLSVSEKYGIVPQNFLFKKKIALNDRTKYLKVEYGNIVYNPFLLWNGAAGTCFFRNGGCTSPAYKVLKPNFPNIEYANEVISEMSRIATKKIFIGDLPRTSHEENHLTYNEEMFSNWIKTEGYYNPHRFNAFLDVA